METVRVVGFIPWYLAPALEAIGFDEERRHAARLLDLIWQKELLTIPAAIVEMRVGLDVDTMGRSEIIARIVD